MTKSDMDAAGPQATSEDDRCFGRLKARKLTSEERELVAGGDECPPPPPPPGPPPPDPPGGPDVFHSGIFGRSVTPGTGGEPNEIGNVYTG